MEPYSPEHLLYSVGRLRPYLPILMGEASERIEQELQSIFSLNLVIKQEADSVRNLIFSYEEPRHWVNRFLKQSAPLMSDNFWSFEPIPDTVVYLPAVPEFACPKCGSVYFRFGVGQVVPECERCSRPRELVVAHYACPKGDYIAPQFVVGEVPLHRCPSHPQEQLVLGLRLI